MELIFKAERFLLFTVLLFLAVVTLGQTETTLAFETETTMADQTTALNEATALDETTTTSEQQQTMGTTTPGPPRLACDTCQQQSVETCLATINLAPCELAEVCYVDVMWINETTFVTAGCTSDTLQCNFQSHDSCLVNQTDCYLCCTTQWCNRDILNAVGSTPAPIITEVTEAQIETTLALEMETTMFDQTTAVDETTTTSEQQQNTGTTTPGPPRLACDTCQQQSVEACLATINLIPCELAEVCYVDVMWINETTYVTAGCTSDTLQCNFQSHDSCLVNQTDCYLCCTTQWCNRDILNAVGSTPAPIITEVTEAQIETTLALEMETTMFDQTTAVDETTTTSEQQQNTGTTTPGPPRLACDTCQQQSVEACLATINLIPCELAEVCYVDVMWINETTYVTAGCTSDTLQCNFQSHDSCLVNQTDCYLCCNTQWCNRDILNAVGPTPEPIITTEPTAPKPTCYSCIPGSARDCLDSSIEETNCPSGSVCFVNITWWNDTFSMGCTLETEHCIFQVTTDDCPNNETSCLLCCYGLYCNVDILDKLVTEPTMAAPITTPTPEVAETITTSPASPETTGEPSEPLTDTQAPPAEETSMAPMSESVQETTVEPESGTTPLPVEQESTAEVPATEGPSTVMPEETSAPPFIATTESPDWLECYECVPGSSSDCEGSSGPAPLCATGSVCYVNITSIGDSWNETVSMGCTPDAGACSSFYHSFSDIACPENETNCLLCCDWKWCNTEIIDKLTPTPPVLTPTPAPPTPDESTDTSTPQESETAEPTEELLTTAISNTETPEPLTTEAPQSAPPLIETTPTPESLTTESLPVTTQVIETPMPESEAPTEAVENTSEPSETFTTPIPPDSPSTPGEIDTEAPQISDLPSTTAASTIAATVAPSTVPPTPRDWLLTCYECVGEPSWFCNGSSTGASASVKDCHDVNEVCLWSVTNNDGSFTTVKGCVQRDECQRLTETNNAYCGDYLTVTENCTWCCEDNHTCNYDRGNYSVTPPPTTAPGSCDMSICLMQFQLLVAQASKEPDLFFNEFCRSVPSVFTCLATTSEACGHCDGGQSEMIEMILANMTAQCPVACDAESGFNCTYSYYHEIIEILFNGGDCRAIYDIVYMSEKCRVRTVGSCDADVRDNIDTAYTSIKAEVEVTCNTTRPTIPPFEGTESPNCQVTTCLKCITDLGDIILLYFNETGGDIFHVCGAIQVHYDCYWRYASECSDGTRHSLEAAWNFTFGLIAEQCAHKICDTTKARTCIVDLMTLIETKKDIQGACRLIPGTIECVDQNTQGCAPDEQESLNRTLKYTLDLIGDQCNDNVKVNCNETIEICEGGDPAQISFIFMNSPDSICGGDEACQIFIDIEIEVGNDPKAKCRNGDPIRQAVVVRSPGSGPTDGSLCSFEVTNDNWNKEQNVSIAAKVDFKYDGTQRRQMIVWYRKAVDGVTAERRSLVNATLYICDQDKEDNMCSSVNDPHIKTFDGWYYNNFLEGFFILWRHIFFPYEVQIATQRCNSHASCNCAVAVRCGDTVLYMDKCRKKSFVQKWCSGNGNNGNGNGNAYGHDKYKCENIMKVHLFGHDRITPGMRIFSKNNGKLFYVWFPHGQMVKITIDGKYLSVWITPSPYDIGNVEGLCGNYDGNSTNDLMYRNQTLYLGEAYNKFRGQPKGFCKNWQAALIENIYNGVALQPYVPDVFCECDGNSKNSSVMSWCSSNALVETCDMEKGDVELLPPFEYTDSEVDNDNGNNGNHNGNNNGNNGNHNGNNNGNNGNNNGNNRRRRQAEDPLADLDMDVTFDPALVTEDPAAMAAATAACNEYFNGISVAQQCQSGTTGNSPVADFTTSIAGCVDDILATNTTDYQAAALEAMKTQCTTALQQNPVLANSPIAASIAAASCPNQCSNLGTCTNGNCTCNPGYTGADCSFNLTSTPQFVEMYNDVCDVTKSDCSQAQVTGAGFVPNVTRCWVKPVKVTENNVDSSGEFKQSSLTFLSQNEVHCGLNTKTSAMVQVENSGSYSNSTLIVVYDSTCWTCTQIPQPSCVRVKDSCIIDNTCYGPGQENPNDKCMICRPGTSDSKWTFNSDSESCSSTNIPLIVGLCVGLGGGLILLTIIIIIIVYKVRCAESKRLTTEDEYDTMSRGSFHRSRQSAYDNLFTNTAEQDVAGSIRGGRFSYKEPPPEYEATSTTFNETHAM